MDKIRQALPLAVKQRIWDTQKALRNTPRDIRRILRRLSARARTMPDFILIGPSKTGTTSLMTYLHQHPTILMSYSGELEFWSHKVRRGINWYRSYFPLKIEVAGIERRLNQKVVVGERSHDYLPDSTVLPRLIANLPHVQVVATLRNPIDRAYSHYRHSRRRTDGRESLTFEEALEQEAQRLSDNPRWPDTAHPTVRRVLENKPYTRFRYYGYRWLGEYARLLRPWVEHWPRDQLLVIRSEDMFENPRRVCQSLMEFLGVRTWFPDEFPAENQGRYPPMKAETREYLASYFKPHNEALAELLGRDFGWD